MYSTCTCVAGDTGVVVVVGVWPLEIGLSDVERTRVVSIGLPLTPVVPFMAVLGDHEPLRWRLLTIMTANSITTMMTTATKIIY